MPLQSTTAPSKSLPSMGSSDESLDTQAWYNKSCLIISTWFSDTEFHKADLVIQSGLQ